MHGHWIMHACITLGLLKTIGHYLTAHWKLWPAPIDQPTTHSKDVIPNFSVTNWCCARTLSWTAICQSSTATHMSTKKSAWRHTLPMCDWMMSAGSLRGIQGARQVTWGKRALSKGGGVLLGLEDSPFPNMLMTRMKYLAGSKAMPGPINQSFSQWRPASMHGLIMVCM